MNYPEKLYPPVPPPSAPTDDEGQSYRLKKIDEVERFLREEVAYRDSIGKRCKRWATALTISDTSVVTTITALEVGSVVSLSTGVGFPVSLALACAGLLLGVGSGIVHKAQKVFELKERKHGKIKTLAEAKLNSISGFVSKAVEDAHVSDQEYQLILKELENYRRLKEQIRTKSKRVVNTIASEQRKAILQQGREQGKQDFLATLARSSATQPANAT